MKRYVITTAQAEVRPHKQFLEGLLNYCTINDAELMILPTFGKEAKERELHPFFKDFTIIEDEFHFNNSIKAQRRRIRPQMIDPATGLTHAVRKGKSVIFESPQIRVKTVATTKTLPKFLLTTGAVTLPNYANSDDCAAERQRLGMIARDNHTYGAIVLDIKNSNSYQFRHLRANSAGVFVDKEHKYFPDKVEDAVWEALIYADWHNGKGVPKHYEASKQMANVLKAKNGVFHDFFDGHSINHHMQNYLISQQLREGVDIGHHDLETELKECGEELQRLSGLHENIYLVPSNHHDFLTRWLDEGRFVKDKQNARLGFQLAKKYADGKDPVEEGVKLVRKKIPKNVKFMRYGENLQIKGFECGQHTHKGKNGSRGSLKSLEEVFGKCIGGHVHTPEEYHLMTTVGTHLPRDIFYAKGSPSGWMCRNTGITDIGTTQSFNVIDGEW